MSSQANTAPRALVHKQILSAAAEMPEASLEEIADEVAGASTPLVERVLEEYGDPADNDDADSTAMSQPDLPIDIDELSSAKRETLAAVLEHPDATQQEIATKLDVSSATVSQRLRDIEGFDWADRGSIVATLAESDVSLTGGGATSQADEEPTAVSSSDEPVGESMDESVSDESMDESVAESPETTDDSAESATVNSKASDAGGEDRSEAVDGSQAGAEPSAVDDDSGAVDTDSDESEPSPGDADEANAESSAFKVEGIQEIEQRLTDLEETVATQREEMESVLERGMSELEADIEETITDGGQFEPQPAIQDDELLAKVIRASIADEQISEEEELQIIEALR